MDSYLIAMDGYGTAGDGRRLLQKGQFWCKIESKIVVRHQDARIFFDGMIELVIL